MLKTMMLCFVTKMSKRHLTCLLQPKKVTLLCCITEHVNLLYEAVQILLVYELISLPQLEYMYAVKMVSQGVSTDACDQVSTAAHSKCAAHFRLYVSDSYLRNS